MTDTDNMDVDFQEEDANILIVDDEEMVLKSIENYLVLETEYNVYAYNSPVDALHAMKDTTIDLIISDYLMPEMTGIDFLLKARDIQPFATRIILTAYADKENAIRAINELGLYQYVEKPWDNEALKLIIRNGLERRRLMQRLEQTIQEFERSQNNLKSIHNRIKKAFV